MPKRTAAKQESSLPPNVVALHQRLTSRHREVLDRWLQAGRCMGLCDACVCRADAAGSGSDYVLVWVRENPDPAYMIASVGLSWRIVDCIRNETLATHPSFEAALDHIRPVLKLHRAA
jgi:hypothetical protein